MKKKKRKCETTKGISEERERERGKAKERAKTNTRLSNNLNSPLIN